MNKYLIDNIPIAIPDSIDEIKSLIGSVIDNNEKKYISFINPEIFIEQRKNKELRYYLQKSLYNIVDGIGIIKAINRKTKSKYSARNRFAGTDFLLYLPDNKNVKIFLYGSKKQNIEKAKDNIEKKYKNIKIVGILDGYSKIENERKIEIINNAKPNILIVCLGCPKQEKWIQQNIDKLNINLVFGNGGAIDFWSGSVKRAPKIIIKIGFEWLFRLITNFSIRRLKRQSKIIRYYFEYVFRRITIIKM